MRKLLATHGGWACLIVRLGLGMVMLPHGLQKLLGWFGGPGLVRSVHSLTTARHLPVWLAVLVIVVESLGSLGLVVGFLTRVAAFGMACDMIGIIALGQWRHGFFMNWAGHKAGEGVEYHLLVLAMSLALMIAGAGHWSIDHAVASRGRART
jgi:putative oxidoreductase